MTPRKCYINFSNSILISRRNIVLNYGALSKIQSIVLIAVIIVGSGISAYVIFRGNEQYKDTIKIGVCADIDNYRGSAILQGVTLAVEQINDAGGLLGRSLEVVAVDDDSEMLPGDIVVASNALTKLVIVDKADFILAYGGGFTLTFQDVVADHKKILFSTVYINNDATQRVIENYEKYKYYFRLGIGNETTSELGFIDGIMTLKNYTGFNKLAFLVEDVRNLRDLASGWADELTGMGFEIVYNSVCKPGTVDFSSYIATIEAAGAEILSPLLVSQSGVSFVKEWYDRQSPCVVWGTIVMSRDIGFWEMTDGKCEYITSLGLPVIAGYPITDKTLSTREAYIDRWGEVPSGEATYSYDAVRFILSAAINKAGTINTEAVIDALEEISVETSLARRFEFTHSHDIMKSAVYLNDPEKDYLVVCQFQWQNGEQIPVYPRKIMEEAEATYMFPDWPGPWDNP